MNLVDVSTPPAGKAAAAAATHGAKAVIFDPWLDFICLGGGFLLLLPAFVLVPEQGLAEIMIGFAVLQNLVNMPHFAASYVLFYEGYRENRKALSANMHARFIFAGLLIPLLLITFFWSCLALRNAALLGLAGNLMLLLVGWHYVKQGYGILMVDSTFKNIFFDARERNILIYNAYSCWLVFWLCANRFVAEHEIWGIKYYSMAVPDVAILIAGGVCAATTALALRIFFLRLGSGQSALPLNGVMAYFSSLYVWLAARFHPVGLVAAAFAHSLQYLLIVWRLEVNRSCAPGRDGAKKSPDYLRLFGFGASILLLGSGFGFFRSGSTRSSLTKKPSSANMRSCSCSGSS